MEVFSKMRNWRNGENFTPMVIEVFKDMKLKNNEYLTQMGTNVFSRRKNWRNGENFFPDGQMRLLILTYLQSTQFRGAKYVDEETTRYAVKLEAAGQSENFPPSSTDLVTGLDQ